MTPDIKSLSASADVWDGVGYVFSAMVSIGVILESIELFKHIRAGKGREKSVEIVAFLILIIGLFGEVYSAIKSNEYNGLVIAKLNDEAAKADDDAARAHDDAAKALDDAANANARAAKIEAENLKMAGEIGQQATYLGGRQLTKDQFDAIQMLNGKLPAILFLTEPHCPECLNFVGQLGAAFKHAGAQVILSMPNLFIGTGMGDLCVYDSPNADLVDQTLRSAGFQVGSCGHTALALFGIPNPTMPVVGVGEQQGFTPPVKAYSEPP